jgi:hypothetical protein
MAATTKRYNKPKSKLYLMTKIFILVIFPFVLLLLPKTIFNNGNYTICLLKMATGEDCFGCGMTRACMHLIHLDFEGAAYFNKISFIVLPILCGLLIAEVIKTVKQYQKVRLKNKND